ncbi:uracil-DNA glycosylase [Cryomorphaceae bacterium 1068]|nr:uracil-DNA glycosylase [Cryomorphaceae bacterium 1068]
MSEIRLHPSWKAVLSDEFTEPYFQSLISFVKQEYASTKVYPPGQLIFSALDHTPFQDVKVVILGQDPYHGPGQANGLCFSVNEGVALPPSLKNIFAEVRDDLEIEMPVNGNLERWADQGVLLLNATLTVRAHQAGSHQNKGWERFTDAAVKALSQKRENIVFMLWGSYAQKKGAVIDRNKHLVLQAPHPSPLSSYRGFFGCKHFSKANAYLNGEGKAQIEW